MLCKDEKSFHALFSSLESLTHVSTSPPQVLRALPIIFPFVLEVEK